ncbi:type IV pilin protein [Luteimonas sp. SX5]|uniref:Type IV pilin protein n=2 Tax=Luteimonas galliterrae TaxID=2940486 RepID=A0ABT0MLM6_9GAMM|nr:type IV pilin protein [Luteimonas galliterrae]
MVVVAVVAILAAIALPSYQESIRKGRRGQAKADLIEIAQLAERFHTVNNTYAGFEGTWPATYRQSPRDGEARYTVDMSDDANATTFVLTATPTGAQAEDRCGMLSVNAAGAKSATGGSVSECF